MTAVLGISSHYHDSAAALVVDGALVAAAQEERFTRRKHDPEFPVHAIQYCLREAGLTAKQIDHVGFYDKPFLKFERLMASYMAHWPWGWRSFREAMPLWLRNKLWIRRQIRSALDFDGPIHFNVHHMSHAASAFLVSPFEEAAILTLDGVGEWGTTTMGVGRGTQITLTHEIKFPHSLGLLYSAMTHYVGFKVNSGEYKLMGLAPNGRPAFVSQLREVIDIRDDGSFALDMRHFDYPWALRMTNRRWDRLFGGPRRSPETPLSQRDADLARSMQVITEEVMLRAARHLREITGMRHLCLAGGVALNCVANAVVLREAGYDDLWIQPAAGDAGGAIGVAFTIWNTALGHPRTHVMKHAYLGPAYNNDQIRASLEARGAVFEHLPDEELFPRVAQMIADGLVIGWYSGWMEFGPRALGSRSILADARDPGMKDRLNEKIKLREGFRPFAPAVLEEEVSNWFELDRPSPYMLLTAQVREDRRTVPSITHVDGSARLQTVSRETSPRFHGLISAFHRLTGCPVIINTSFNVRGEPIVNTPDDAYRCFMRTGMDVLVLRNHLLIKEKQPPLPPEEASETFEAD
ncbi:MAG: carbamoyltransferase [Candidatus Sumerlaeia bacterium]|nr:carbamoyltransferase [Candidatus Sumerlaeia bacterium]